MPISLMTGRLRPNLDLGLKGRDEGLRGRVCGIERSVALRPGRSLSLECNELGTRRLAALLGRLEGVLLAQQLTPGGGEG